MKKKILDNRQITIGEVADGADVSISFGSYQTVFLNVLINLCLNGVYCFKISKFWECVIWFVKNVQNGRKTTHEFCTMLTPHLTHRCLCVNFWPNNRSHDPTTVFADLGICWLLSLPETEDTNKRKALKEISKKKNSKF